MFLNFKISNDLKNNRSKFDPKLSDCVGLKNLKSSVINYLISIKIKSQRELENWINNTG